MPTLTRTFKVDEIFEEWDRIEEALRLIGVPVDQMCLLDIAVQSLAYDLVNRAGALGIQAQLLAMQQVEAEDWIGDPVETEVLFTFPDHSNAVWFRTMVL